MTRTIHQAIRLLTILLLLLAATACGSRKGTQAYKSYRIGEYHRAEGLLKAAYSGENNKFQKAEYSYYLGESYRQINQPKKATLAYGKAIRYKYPEPLVYLYLAECHRKLGEYDKAQTAYAAFLEQKSFDRRAVNGMASCQMATENATEKGWEVTKLKELNSKYSDFAATFADPSYDQIIFTSMRSESKKRKLNRITGQGNSSLYMSNLDSKGQWTRPEKLTDPIPSAFDSGTPNVTGDLKTLFFTHCPYDKTKPSSAQVFETVRSGGRWGELMPVVPGGDSLMVAHPAISPDGRTLFFVSDREGGQGGKDLYRSIRQTEGWSKAENMGSLINTPGDEMYPYVRSDGTLYFASDGQIGYGGLDLFKAVTGFDGNFVAVENMGQPLNSASDDFAIVFKGKKDEGIFSSSRGNARGYDDLYTFKIPEVHFDLLGKISTTSREVPENVQVRLIGTDGTNLKLTLRSDGSFGAPLSAQTDYLVTASAPGYFHAKTNCSTKGLTRSKTLEITLRLTGSQEVLSLEPIYFSGDSISAESKSIVAQAAMYLKNNTTFQLQIRSHSRPLSGASEAHEASEKRGRYLVQLLVRAGIDASRIKTDAAGSDEPLVIDARQAQQHPLLREGDQLTPALLRRFRIQDRRQLELLNDRIQLTLTDR